MVENPGAAVAAPGSSVQSKIATSPPSTRRRRGGRASALHAVRRSAPADAGKVSMAPRRNGRGLWGYAPACCGRLCQSVPSSTLAVRACTSRRAVHRHATRPRYGAFTPRLKPVAAIRGKERSRSSLGVCLARVRAQAGEAVTRGCRVGHVSIRERAACASLACRESWRGNGCALGFMAATFQRKQFPLRCAHSSRDKFFSLPGSPRCCDRCAVRPAHPPPAGSQQGRTGATLFNPKGEKHHG